MNTTRLRHRTARAALLALGGLLVLAIPAEGQGPSERDIGEFVDAQGTFDAGFLVIPPVANFLGASDPDAGLSLSVDYAGLADEACDGIAETTFRGSVREFPMPDGRAEVVVELETFDAITWVIDGFDFANDPVIFGTRWEEVKKGRDKGDCIFRGPLGIGDSLLRVRFINPEPGGPLPDLIQLFFFPEEGQEVLAFSLEAEALGLLPDGTLAVATTVQRARATPGGFVFSREEVTVEPLD